LSGPALEFKTTKIFDKSFATLPPNIQKRTLEKLALYENDPHHPSFRVKRLEGMRDIWEMSVTKSYRITFQRESEIVLLRNIGTHEILKKERQG
jgi:mRNA-degrading endonuclease RelE of RelBE toxin-antitoxin system